MGKAYQDARIGLGLDRLTLALASLGIGRTGTMIGFFQLTMWLGHGSFTLSEKLKNIEGELKSPRRISEHNLFSIAI